MDNKYFDKFAKEVLKMEPINFFGIAKLMCVQVSLEGETSLRPVEDIIADIFNKFAELSNKKQKEILKLCKDANRSGKNGHRTKNSDTQKDTND